MNKIMLLQQINMWKRTVKNNRDMLKSAMGDTEKNELLCGLTNALKMVKSLQGKRRRLLARIKKESEAFEKLSRQEKKVAIAKDVINQVLARKFFAKTNNFIDHFSFAFNDEVSVQEILADDCAGVCSACALGGLFLSATKFNNNVKASELKTGTLFIGDRIARNKGFDNKLLEIFTREELAVIENAFENGNGYVRRGVHYTPDNNGEYAYYWSDSSGLSANLEDKVGAELLEKLNVAADYKFKHNLVDHDETMLHIMRNIVENKGEFIP